MRDQLPREEDRRRKLEEPLRREEKLREERLSVVNNSSYDSYDKCLTVVIPTIS